ncbi:MAG TPA: recombination protein NinB [Sphingobium sp.]
MTQTLILTGATRRAQAKRLIDLAPDYGVVTVSPPKRTNGQNSLLWAMLSEISRAKPEGRSLPPETWKALFMTAAGFPCTFVPGLDNEGIVPLGFKSSCLNRAEFSDLIEAVHEYAARHGIVLHDERSAA